MNEMEMEKRKKQLGGGDSVVKPNAAFRYFNDQFANLTQSKSVVTKWPLVSCMISYNSKLAVTVTKKDEREYFVKMYDLITFKQTFEEKIGGLDESYIKLKEVEQNETGTFFAIAYADDGYFRLRTFGETARATVEEIASDELDINMALNLDNFMMPIDNFPDPFINCCFVTNELIYANLYHNFTTTHHSFVYNHVSKQVSSHQAVKMNSNIQNFPWKCFYSKSENEVFSFYR